jgi:4-amino-4-deoxy-L-arabinose transferase-like glycosyltransferase
LNRYRALFEKTTKNRWVQRNPDVFLLSTLSAVAAISIFHRLSSGSLPPFDDTTYALVSRSILTSGDWITMHWLNIPYHLFGKPPLNFWITALFFKLFPIGEFSARLSTAIHGVLGVVVVYFLGKELHSRFVGFAAGLFLLSLPAYFRLSQSAMLDVPVTFYILLSLLFYLLAERTGRIGYYALFGICFGLAVMTKSLVGILCLIIIGLYHALRLNLKPVLDSRFALGVGIGFLTCFPWHFWEYLRFGKRFFTQFFFDSFTYNALTVLVNGHRSSISFYIKTLYEDEPVHLAIIVVSLAMTVAMAIRKNRAGAFLLAQISAVFILFSAFQTRMSWYITPAFPAMAISSGILVERLYRIRRLSLIVAAAAVILFAFAMRQRWTEEHWYLTGDPDLKQIISDFKSKTINKDVLYSYEIGDPLNTALFYGDRNCVNIITSREAFENQKKIGVYIKAGYVVYIGSEDALAHWMKSGAGRYVLFTSGTYANLKNRLSAIGASTFASNPSYVIERGPQ